MEHLNEYKKLIKNYIENFSIYKVDELVYIKKYGPPQRPYVLTKIKVNDDGEFLYELTSPRSNSTLPMLFNYNELERYQGE